MVSSKLLAHLSVCMIIFIENATATGCRRNTLKIQQITGPFGCGEGPHWDGERKVLYMVDILNALVIKYDPATGKVNSAKVDGPDVSFILPVKDKKDKFVVGIGRSLAIITWDGVSTTVPQKNILLTVENDKPNNRFNDGKADPRGRVFAGTMMRFALIDELNEDRGNLYSFGVDRKLKNHLTQVGISNGLAWSEDNKVLYYVDSLARNIYAFDYDIETGDTTNQRIVFDLNEYNIPGVADGMTIDRNGNLWVAVYGGSMVIQVNPRNGTLIRKLPMPGRDITSVAFIGDNFDQLVVTSANQDLPESEIDLIPEAGATFLVTGLGVQGCDGVAAVI